MAEQRAAGQGGPRARAATTPTSTPTARSSSSSAPPTFVGYIDDTADGPGARRAPTSTATATTTSSRSSSTARRSTPRAAARSATRGTITTETGTAEVARHDVRPAQPAPSHRPASPTARSPPGQRGHGGDRRRPARRRSAATTPPPTCCTTPCARCSATTSSRPARSSRPTGCASTSPTTSRSPPTRSTQIEQHRQRGDARQHAGPVVRDDQGRGRGARRHRLLRRQVRRRRARARGRPVDRAVRRHARPRDRRHRHDQGRQRGLDRLQPAAHRGGHRRRQRGAAAARRARCSPRPPSCVGAPGDDLVGGVQRKLDELRALDDEIKALRVASWPPAGPASWPPAAVDGVVVAARRRAGARTTCASWRSPCATRPASTSSCSPA